jgi:hypothetical protein
MTEQNGFEEWAVLELMGHRRLAGKVTDAVIGGGAFIGSHASGCFQFPKVVQFPYSEAQNVK